VPRLDAVVNQNECRRRRPAFQARCYHGRVSRPVSFADVRRRVLEFGERANLVTVTPEGLPHVVSAVVRVDGERLVIRVGPRTHTNLAARPSLTLTWPPRGDGEYLLILDGQAEAIGEPDDGGVRPVSIAVGRGILHRLAELPEPGPSCVVLGAH
jgi:hypothetical protein